MFSKKLMLSLSLLGLFGTPQKIATFDVFILLCAAGPMPFIGGAYFFLNGINNKYRPDYANDFITRQNDIASYSVDIEIYTKTARFSKKLLYLKKTLANTNPQVIIQQVLSFLKSYDDTYYFYILKPSISLIITDEIKKTRKEERYHLKKISYTLKKSYSAYIKKKLENSVKRKLEERFLINEKKILTRPTKNIFLALPFLIGGAFISFFTFLIWLH